MSTIKLIQREVENLRNEMGTTGNARDDCIAHGKAVLLFLLGRGPRPATFTPEREAELRAEPPWRCEISGTVQPRGESPEHVAYMAACDGTDAFSVDLCIVVMMAIERLANQIAAGNRIV